MSEPIGNPTPVPEPVLQPPITEISARSITPEQRIEALRELNRRRSGWDFIWEWTKIFAVSVVLFAVIRTFFVEAFKIPSGSMIPTLLVGDHIFVNKLAYGPLVPFSKKRLWNGMPPRRGDVIVFAFPENPDEDFIKRVIALPGDKLEVKDARVWLNDKPIPRCFVGRTSYADVPENGPMMPTLIVL